MKIKLTRNTVVNKKAHLAGEIVDTEKAAAIELIAIKKAVAVDEKQPETVEEAPAEEIETADLPVETVETATAGPQKRKRSKS